MNSMLRDRDLAPAGLSKIDFAARSMPVLRAIQEEFARTRPLAGIRIAACLHVTSETANLCRALIAGGAELALCASNPLSTKDDVAASIHADFGAGVYAIHGCDRDTYYRQLAGALSIGPNIVMDDGADLTTAIHTKRQELLPPILGGTEVTTTGVVRMRNMALNGVLKFPVIAVNDAETKHLFDNRYGTGQNTIDGILRATNRLIAGSAFVVVGYGWCGRGVAMRARGLGARVIVVEVDPIRALEAVMEGYEVMPIGDAARLGDIFVTVTGNRDAITLAHLERMKDGAIVCNSGHFDLEIDVKALREHAVRAAHPRPNVTDYTLADGRIVTVLAEGRLVGQSCAEAHPPSVMDLTFAAHALAVRYLVDRRDLAADVHTLPRRIDEHIAREKLAACGIRLDELSEAQQEYLAAWEVGT